MFEIEGKDISELNDSDLRSLIGLLCEAELRSLNLPTAGVTWGGHQNAKDGGIDVRVELKSSFHSDGFIPRSNTGYQVKKPDMPRSAIYKEMMLNSEPKQVIKDLIALNGAYIIVSSQGSTADSALKDRKDAMQEVVNDFSSTSNIKIDFYDRERIAGWVRSFPALGIWVREKVGRPIQGWRTFGNWARSPGGLKEEYLLDEQIRLYSSGYSNLDGLSALEGLNKLRAILERPKSNIRLVGLSGVGKTRLVQALFDDRIGNSPLNPSTVFYTDISDGPNPDPCTLAERLVNQNSRATLIVDNCPPELHNRLVAVGGKSNSLLSIITVEYDVREDQPEETEVFRLEPASKELIGHILMLRFSHISEVNARTIAEFSGGNARIAIALANTVKRGENLTGLRDNVLFKRLFEQRNEPNHRLLQVAELCSLVYSFDSSIDDTGNNELSILGSLVEMSTREIHENVSELIRRDLVQKRSIWRAVLPHAIANKLAQRALENIPINIICNTFEKGENDRLLKSFSRRLGFLHDSEEAKEISNRWLNEGGLLGNVSNLNEFGISLLKNIAPVNQELVLASIEKVLLLEEANTFFSRENPNYNEFTRLLYSIAYEQKYFERSSNLLCLFALSERPDENYNSIRKMLKTLFQLYLSGTKATAEQRLNIIDKLVVSNIHNERQLGLLLLEVALKTDSFISNHYFEFGAHSRDYGFYPKNLKEIQQWYKIFIQYSLEHIMNNGPVANKVKGILGGKYSGLWLKTGLYEELEHCAKKVSEKGFWGEAWVAVKSIKKHNQENMETGILSRLDELDKLLKPTSLVEQVRLYVLYEDSFSLVDTFDETNSDEFIQIEDTTKSLGNEVGSNYEILNELLPDILSCNNWLMFNFGQGLAGGTLNSEIIWEGFISKLNDTEKTNINYQVIRGFLNTLSKNNLSLCNKILDGALKNKTTAEVFPLLQTSIEIDESSVKRLFESLESGSSPIWQYSNLAYGRVHETINDGDFYKLIKLISSQPKGLEVAIKILHMRIHGQKKNEQHNKTIIGLGQELLTMYQFQRKTSRNDRSDYELSEIIKASYVTNSAKENAKTLGDKLLNGFKSHDIYPWDYSSVLEALASTQPEAFLETFLESNEDNREIDTLFLDELRTRANPISKINKEVIIEWCEANPETRYLLLARAIMPYCKFKESNKLQWTPLALEIIEKSDEPIKILDVFKYSFLPRTWSGSLAAVKERRLPLIYELKEHQDRSVVNWAAKQQVELESSIRQARENEVKVERRRNERFE